MPYRMRENGILLCFAEIQEKNPFVVFSGDKKKKKKKPSNNKNDKKETVRVEYRDNNGLREFARTKQNRQRLISAVFGSIYVVYIYICMYVSHKII